MVEKMGNAVVKIIAFIAVVVIVIGVLSAGFDTVDASHKAVLVQFGKIQGTMDPGMKWTGMFVDAIQYDMRVRKMTVTMQGDQSAVDKDGQSVYATIDINFRLKPDSVINVYSHIGTDSQIADVLNVQGIIKEGFKTVTSKYTSTEIWQDREKVKIEAIEQISKNFPAEYFTLENVVVTNLDYNPAFKNAIEQQKVNEKMALAKEQEVNVKKYEADMKIQEARGTAESTKLAAEADAYTKKVMADSIAYQTLAVAKSEAEGLKLKKAELTPLMVENNRIDAWKAGGAQVPNYVIGDVNGGFLLQLPNPANN
jgi:regulator of protease activity HflC (stomatin/prohibitin superfamily)